MIILSAVLLQGLFKAQDVTMAASMAKEKREDRGRIVFSSFVSGRWELCLIKSDGTGMKQLTNSMEDEYSPAVSSNGNEILYVDHQRSIHHMRFDGSDKSELTLPNGINAQLAWSPDSRKFTFVSTRNGNREIWVVSVIGGNPRQLTDTEKTCKEPFWTR